MPYLNLRLAAQPSDALAKAAAQALNAATAGILGKRPEVTSVLVEFVPGAQWFVAGEAAEAGGFATFHLDIKITAGTNTKDEKAAYVREVFRAMETLLGNVHPASYVVLHELPADAWGYGGETQEYRYVKGRPA